MCTSSGNSWSIFSFRIKRTPKESPMKSKFLKLLTFVSLALCLFCGQAVQAQTVVSGEIDGTVKDPSGAVVPNTSVNLSSSETGFNQSTTTDSNVTFRFALLNPD